MTAKEENKLSMFLAVKIVCDRNPTVWQTLPAFADAYADFGTRITNIQNLSQTQAINVTGLAADKAQLRKAMATTACEIAAAVNAYAKKNKNNELDAKTRCSMTFFMNSRDTMAGTSALNLHGLATANLANLAAFGITAAKLTAFKTKIDGYIASISKPRDAVGSARTSTSQMKAEFHAASTVLRDQLDALLPQFSSVNAKFVQDYQNARITVDNSGGGPQAKPSPTPKPV